MTHINELPDPIKYHILSFLDNFGNIIKIDKSWKKTTLEYYSEKKFQELSKTNQFIQSLSEILYDNIQLTNLLNRNIYALATSDVEIDNISKNVKKKLIKKSVRIVQEADLSSELLLRIDEYLSRKEIDEAKLILSLISDEDKREEAIFKMVKSYFHDEKLEDAWSYYKEIDVGGADDEIFDFSEQIFDRACEQKHFPIIAEIISYDQTYIDQFLERFSNKVKDLLVLLEIKFPDEYLFSLMDLAIQKLLENAENKSARKLWVHYMDLLSRDLTKFRMPTIFDLFIENDLLQMAQYFISLIDNRPLHDKLCVKLYKILVAYKASSEALIGVLNQIKNQSMRNLLNKNPSCV